MVNRCEPVIKTVNENKRKWLLRLSQKASRRGRVVDMLALVAHISSGRQQAPNPTCFSFETWQPRRVPLLGQSTVRKTYGPAGLGSRKKRMPCCNGADTGFNVTRRESAPTSDRSFIAREFGEPLQEEIANDLI